MTKKFRILKKLKILRFLKLQIKNCRTYRKGEVVARFSMEKNEFGPRALGNRSISADPRKADILNVINKKIKVRDFWPLLPK